MSEQSRERLIPLAGSVLLHLFLFAVLVLSFQIPSEFGAGAAAPAGEPIEATAVSREVVEKQIEQLKKEEQQKKAAEEAERKKLADEARKAREAREQEERRIQELKRQAAEQEKERINQEKVERERILAEAEKLKKQREAEEKKLAELKKQQEEQRKQAEKLKQEELKKSEQEKAQKAEQDKKAQEELKKKQAAEQALKQQLAAEQARLAGEQAARQAAMNAGLANEWASAIGDKVRRNWSRPIGSPPAFECKVQVFQTAAGEVQQARVISSCGNTALDRSVEAAVMKASPLPPAPNQFIFDKEIVFTFKP